MPSVVGKRLAEAKADLNAAGFTNISTMPDDASDGTVVSQDPPASGNGIFNVKLYPSDTHITLDVTTD
jgi:beta-lactam-binding protein with PASTA domain